MQEQYPQRPAAGDPWQDWDPLSAGVEQLIAHWGTLRRTMQEASLKGASSGRRIRRKPAGAAAAEPAESADPAVAQPTAADEQGEATQDSDPDCAAPESERSAAPVEELCAGPSRQAREQLAERIHACIRRHTGSDPVFRHEIREILVEASRKGALENRGTTDCGRLSRWVAGQLALVLAGTRRDEWAQDSDFAEAILWYLASRIVSPWDPTTPWFERARATVSVLATALLARKPEEKPGSQET